MAVEEARCDYNEAEGGWPTGTFREGDIVCVRMANGSVLATFRREIQHHFEEGEAMDPHQAVENYVVRLMDANEDTIVEQWEVGKYNLPNNPNAMEIEDGGRRRRKRKSTRKRKTGGRRKITRKTRRAAP